MLLISVISVKAVILLLNRYFTTLLQGEMCIALEEKLLLQCPSHVAYEQACFFLPGQAGVAFIPLTYHS